MGPREMPWTRGGKVSFERCGKTSSQVFHPHFRHCVIQPYLPFMTLLALSDHPYWPWSELIYFFTIDYYELTCVLKKDTLRSCSPVPQNVTTQKWSLRWPRQTWERGHLRAWQCWGCLENTRSSQSIKQILLHCIQRELPWYCTSGFQNYVTNFCSFKPPGVVVMLQSKQTNILTKKPLKVFLTDKRWDKKGPQHQPSSEKWN